jgi:hypothetical protein
MNAHFDSRVKYEASDTKFEKIVDQVCQEYLQGDHINGFEIYVGIQVTPTNK